jgi:arylsulfatase
MTGWPGKGGAGTHGRAGGGSGVITQPLIFSADETTDIGDDHGLPVSADYAGASRFNAASTWSRSMSATTTTPT